MESDGSAPHENKPPIEEGSIHGSMSALSEAQRLKRSVLKEIDAARAKAIREIEEARRRLLETLEERSQQVGKEADASLRESLHDSGEALRQSLEAQLEAVEAARRAADNTRKKAEYLMEDYRRDRRGTLSNEMIKMIGAGAIAAVLSAVFTLALLYFGLHGLGT
jgi:uncharacterized protein YhaN